MLLLGLLQGIYPAGLEKVKSQELREFIQLCIAHNPANRPDTRQLLKHPFFESIRTGKVQVERAPALLERPSEEAQVRHSAHDKEFLMQLYFLCMPCETPA